MINPKKKVFVSGCFDLLHSGHIAFLQEAATYGDLYVGIGSDQTIKALKGRPTVYTQEERKYMLNALDCVTECRINRGNGILDFLQDLNDIKPDILVVNEDGATPDKAELCAERGMEYVILSRIPYQDLPRRSTTSLRTLTTMPYRIDLAGTWIDQPYVSKYHSGAAILTSIEPTLEFFERSGMATSTRRAAYELWPGGLPLGKPEEMARLLFYYDNPPGTEEVSGSQDALGLVMPGLNRVFYDGKGYWPVSIDSVHDESILSWLESHLRLITLWPRPEGYNVLKDTAINTPNVTQLAEAADGCWQAILDQNFKDFGHYFKASFEAQVRMFPHMMNEKIQKVIDQYKDRATGWKLSGAGGGGYLILVTEEDIPNTIRIKIRRREL